MPDLTAALGWRLTAHIHHYFESVRQGKAKLHAAVDSAFQFLYTGVFGAYACFLLLTTGSLAAAMACHFICNFVGVPSTEFTEPDHPLYRFRLGVWALFAVGFIVFVYMSTTFWQYKVGS